MNRDKKVIIELRKRTAAESEGSLFIRISVGGKKPYERESLGYVVPEVSWDAEEQRIKKGFPNYEQINRQISGRLQLVKESVQNITKSGKALTNEAAGRILGGGESDIIQYWEDYITYLKQPRKSKSGELQKFSVNYIKKLRSELNRLTKYTGGSYPFSAIDKKWLEGYETYCLPDLDAKTSLAVTFAKLHTILVRAEDEGLFAFSQVRGFLWPTYSDPERPYLTLEQTGKIEEQLYGGKMDSDLQLKSCAAYFLVECYCGIRFSDWSRFTIDKIISKDAIKVRATKNGQPIYFPLSNSPKLSKAVTYIRKNHLTPPETNQHANRLLKIVGSMAKIPVELTTHVGRHTAATLLLELGYSEAAVGEFLGISLRTVAIYAKSTRKKLQNEYARLGGI